MNHALLSKHCRTLRSVALGFGALFVIQPLAQAQDQYTGGHGDFGVEYIDGSNFIPHWHLHEGAIVNGSVLTEETEYTTLSDLVAVTSASDNVTGNLSNSGMGSIDWLGVASGSAVFRLGNENFEPDLGFGLEELSEADWLDSDITIRLSTFSGPGNVAILSGTASGFSIYASSFDPTSSASGVNSWLAEAGGHSHPVFYFSEVGNYNLTFTWSGTYTGDGAAPGGTPVSGTGTFGIAVVPEPSTYVLLGLGLASLFFLRGLRKTQANKASLKP